MGFCLCERPNQIKLNERERHSSLTSSSIPLGRGAIGRSEQTQCRHQAPRKIRIRSRGREKLRTQFREREKTHNAKSAADYRRKIITQAGPADSPQTADGRLEIIETLRRNMQ